MYEYNGSDIQQSKFIFHLIHKIIVIFFTKLAKVTRVSYINSKFEISAEYI